MFKSFYYRHLIGFEQALKKLQSGELDDDSATEIYYNIVCEYEGGTFDENSYHIAQNEKDQKIQILMREQLLSPINKPILLKTMDLLYFLEEGNNLDLLEVIIANHSNLLTENEKFHYRLHYASVDLDQFTKIISDVNDSTSKYEQGYYNSEFFYGLTNFISISDGYNELKTEAAQGVVKTYLDKNPVYEEGSGIPPNLHEYGNWLTADAAASGEDNLEQALYKQALKTNDPIKILAIIECLIDSYEPEYYTSEYYEKLLNNKTIQRKLEQAYLDTDTADEIKLGIQFRLRGISDLFPFDDSEEFESEPEDLNKALLTMSAEEKAETKIMLEQALKHQPFFHKILLWLFIKWHF
jgi:hypothetical protein